MIIDGKKIAQEILSDLAKRTSKLKAKNIYPAFIIIIVGQNSLSSTFVERKKKKAREVGIKTYIETLPASTSARKLREVIQKYNLDPKIHGIIVQLPLPLNLLSSSEKILNTIIPQKDIDGFRKDSPYTPAVAQAVLKILSECSFYQIPSASRQTKNHLTSRLKGKKILIIGRGPTAGGPIAKTFAKLGIPFKVAHSKTENLAKLTKNSEIIISCVGKENLLTGEMIKKGAIVIDVGINRNQSGHLVGDSEVDSISRVASFYTPTPGGVGPLTVAYLLKNIFEAASHMQYNCVSNYENFKEGYLS